MKTKNIFTKILCVILTVVTACFAFVACGETPPPAEEGGGTQVTVTDLIAFRMPNQTEYYSGEEFNPAGLVFQLTFSDGSKRAISPQMCEASITGALPADATKITFTYEGFSVDIPISVRKKGSVVSTVLKAEKDNAYASTKTLLGEYKDGSEGVTMNGCNGDHPHYEGGIWGLDQLNRSLTYTFTVTEDGKVDFIWNVAGSAWSANGNLGIADMAAVVTVTIDGKAVNVSGIALPAGPVLTDATDAEKNISNYWNVQQVILKDVELTAGEHTFSCATKQNGGKGLNVASMEIYFE